MGHYVKSVLGPAIMLAGVAALVISILKLVDIGTCGSDGTYAPIRPCPAGTEYYILAIFPAVISMIVGAGIFAARSRDTPSSLSRPRRAVPRPAARGAVEASGPVASPVEADPLARLERLAELKKAGVLSQEEFDEQKARLLRET